MSVLLVGGDVRQKFAYEHLRSMMDCVSFADSCDGICGGYGIIALPVPVTRDGAYISGTSDAIDSFAQKIDLGTTVLGGKIPSELINALRDRGVKCFDYNNLVSFQIRNAVLTAEGAIYYLRQYYDKCLYGSSVAILGFGRIGKILAYLLHAHGAKICVCARKESDAVWCRAMGIGSVKIKNFGLTGQNKDISESDVIFNTIPYNVINESLAENIPSDTPVIDLASEPYGIDGGLVKKYGLNYHIEAAIPGRYAPRSAGRAVAEAIFEIIRGREEIL